jgi:hypothetical protein
VSVSVKVSLILRCCTFNLSLLLLLLLPEALGLTLEGLYWGCTWIASCSFLGEWRYGRAAKMWCGFAGDGLVTGDVEPLLCQQSGDASPPNLTSLSINGPGKRTGLAPSTTNYCHNDYPDGPAKQVKYMAAWEDGLGKVGWHRKLGTAAACFTSRAA